ncbi:MAG: cell division protein FtsA [Spirochaetales bacterium]
MVVGLDLGTSKTVCMLGGRDENGFRILGVGEVPSEGVRSGHIVNIRAAVKCIQAAVAQAEASASGETPKPEFRVRRVTAGLAGGSVDGLNSRGVVAVSAQAEIGPRDVERVIDAAKAVLIPMDREIIHVLPQEYIVDDVRKLRDPLEMMGIRLEAEVHIITSSRAVSSNLVQGLNGAGLEVEEIVLDTLASTLAVLNEEEKQVGVLLIDLGAGTTDVVLFHEGAPHFSKVYSLGSERVTKDIAHVLQIPETEAERLKVESGHTWLKGLTSDDEVVVREVGARPAFALRRSELGRIIQARIREILEQVLRDVQRTGLLDQLGAGIVVTGGGAHLEGLVELAGEVFGKTARMGVPSMITGLGDQWQRPEYTACVGLVKWAYDRVPEDQRPYVAGTEIPAPRSASADRPAPRQASRPVPKPSGSSGVWAKVWDFIKKNFI